MRLVSIGCPSKVKKVFESFSPPKLCCGIASLEGGRTASIVLILHGKLRWVFLTHSLFRLSHPKVWIVRQLHTDWAHFWVVTSFGHCAVISASLVVQNETVPGFSSLCDGHKRSAIHPSFHGSQWMAVAQAILSSRDVE